MVRCNTTSHVLGACFTELRTQLSRLSSNHPHKKVSQLDDQVYTYTYMNTQTLTQHNTTQHNTCACMKIKISILTEEVTEVNSLLQIMECYLQKVVTAGPGMSLETHRDTCVYM